MGFVNLCMSIDVEATSTPHQYQSYAYFILPHQSTRQTPCNPSTPLYKPPPAHHQHRTTKQTHLPSHILMATKASLAAALLVAMVALATATATTFDEEASENYQQCRQQVQGRRFHSCQRFLQQRSTNEDEEVLDSYQPSSSLQACCQELKQMDRQQCGCEAIRQAVKQAQQSTRRYQTGQSEQVYQQARALPRRCGLREQQCHFRLLFV